MLVVRSMGALALIAAVGVYTPVTVSAQQSTVVAHSVSVSEDGSSLEFELANGKTITIELADGTIRINGETAGAYGTGGELEASWRSLLSHGGPLSSPELLEALQGWEVDGLEGAEVQIQAAIAASLDNLDVVIANAMAAAQIAAAVEVQDAQERARGFAEGMVIDLNRLTGALGVMEQLDEFRDGLGDTEYLGFQVENGRIHVGDLTVRRGQVIEGNLAVLSGDISVFGTIKGNLVALDGDILLRSGGRIEGDALAINGTVTRAGGYISGRVRSARGVGVRPSRGRSRLAPLAERSRARQTSVVDAVGQNIATLFGFFVALACIGFGFTFFMPRQLQVVSETVSDSFGKSFLAGLFATPLILPAGVMLVAGLAITIVGIPLAILAVPALILGTIGATVLGYLAAANSVGHSYLLRKMADGQAVVSTPYRSVVYGLIGLLAIWAPAALLGWIPLVGPLFLLLALTITWAMATAGVGAAILSRAGLRATFVRTRPEAALTDEHYWEPDSSMLPPAHRGRTGP